jgi:hypothetical protein
MEVADSSETLVSVYLTTKHHTPYIIQCHENLKTQLNYEENHGWQADKMSEEGSTILVFMQRKWGTH